MSSADNLEFRRLDEDHELHDETRGRYELIRSIALSNSTKTVELALVILGNTVASIILEQVEPARREEYLALSERIVRESVALNVIGETEGSA